MMNVLKERPKAIGYVSKSFECGKIGRDNEFYENKKVFN